MLRRSLVFLTTVPIRTECTLDINCFVAQIVFNRPARKNALGRTFLQEFKENLKFCAHNKDVRCVVLTSAVEGVFCSGADLKERKEMTPGEARLFVNDLRQTFTDLEELPVPTIAAIEGSALGGGLEVALACDIRILGRKAKLGVPETGLAIIPGAGGTQRLTKAVGVSRAKELAFTALPVTADKAAAIGLANECVDDGKSLEVALQMARRIAENGPIAVTSAKRAINGGYGHSVDYGMLLERACYENVLASHDRLEGLAAFAEKRKPVFTGN